jgi:hypothetical protein
LAQSSAEILHGFSVSREHVPPATQIRSTLLVSSQHSLRKRDHFERYLELVRPDQRDTLASLVVGVWCPIAQGMAHYEACEQLELGEQEILGIGHDVEERLRSSILLNLAHAARGVGVTPTMVLGQAPKFWTRTFVGSEVQLERLGPKDLRLTLGGFPFAHLTYNRVSFRGILQSLIGPFCRSATVRDARECSGPASIGWRVAWV